MTAQTKLLVHRTSKKLNPVDALEGVIEQIDNRYGAILSSGFDYPGRHSRWDIGFVDPAIVFRSSGKKFSYEALNEKGEIILDALTEPFSRHPHFEGVARKNGIVSGSISENSNFFSEEERSRQPSVFSALRLFNDIFGEAASTYGEFGFYGAFGYDLIFQFEKLDKKLSRAKDQDDCVLFLPLEITVVDRKKELAERISFEVSFEDQSTASRNAGGQTFETAEGSGSSEIESDHQLGEFADKVTKVVDGTVRGDYFEVVLSQQFSTRFDDSPTALFHRLAKLNPSPYLFLVNLGSEQLVGSSPEMFVRVTGTLYETCPIAGTVKRGNSALEDAEKVRELLLSRKEESELTMCTDVDRNDMARVCKPGSVTVVGRRQLEFYSHLIHTVDHVQGTLADEYDGIDAFQTHMWACTVTGAPKPAALQEIENLENSPRGWYSGAIGFLGVNGDINTGITLRTAHLKDGRAHLRAGATLLHGSDPDAEERETRTKAAATLAALTATKSASEEKSPVFIQSKDFKGKKVLLIDYRDSFVHNLGSYLRELRFDVTTLREGFDIALLDSIKPDIAFLSPGPGTPEDFGVPAMVGSLLERNLPLFGVCLGHQGIGQHFGGTIKVLPKPEHGKPALISHKQHRVFEGIPAPFKAGRYHSLYIEDGTIDPALKVVAYNLPSETSDIVVPMAFCHEQKPIVSVQFHPESLMTAEGFAGHKLLENSFAHLLAF